MKIKAGEMMNMRTRAENARRDIENLKPCGKAQGHTTAMCADVELQDDVMMVLREYMDLLTQLINNAELVI